MIDIRDFDSFGKAEHGWLSARHHFSFGEYRNPDRMNWSTLRVWNDDTIQPDTGFERHGHRDMEIITFVRQGTITHTDHLGNKGRTQAGDVQVMSAGSGIFHDEFNREKVVTQIFQIWITPNEHGGPPHWQQRSFPTSEHANQLVELASGRAHASSTALPIRQDAGIFGAHIEPGHDVRHTLEPNRYAYLTVSKGCVSVNGHEITERSSAAITAEDVILIAAPQTNQGAAEIVLADLPPNA